MASFESAAISPETGTLSIIARGYTSLMLNIRAATSILTLLIASTLFATAADSIGDLPKKALERSQITLPGSRPFLLKAKVVETTNLANADYHAEIEEYWVAPNKWRRTVKTNKFSETLIVNGDQTSEQITGDYYPNWLRTMVAALFDPGARFQGVDLSRSSDNPVFGGTKVCRRFTFMSGIAPVSNKEFSSFCFDNGLIDFVALPGYEAVYKNYEKFAGKQVARTISERIEDGTILATTVDELSELKSPDEALFAIQAASTPLQTIRADESTLRSLAVSAPDITWPTVRSGRETGTLGLYVCLDRDGHVREIYELNSSNPGLSDVARDQVMKWQFKPATNQGARVQVESILTFAFNTTVADPVPILEEKEGLKLVLNRVEPTWPAGFMPVGTPVIVTLAVSENGECKGFVFVSSNEADPSVMMNPGKISQIEKPLRDAVKQWRFQQYVRNGKATEFQVRVTFHVN